MCSIEKRGNLFILTLTGNGEHRLSPTLINSILSSLSQIKNQASKGSILITNSHGKFFSNGFDLPWARSAASLSEARSRLHHMVQIFKPVIAEFLSFPIPTIAALSGHAAAAGFVLALSHDYLIMRRDRGVLYMSEVDLGMTLPDYFRALFRSKIGSGSVRRDVFLKGMKVRGEDGVKMGIVESVHEGEEGVMEAALSLGEELGKRNWDLEAYKEIRKSLFPEISGLLGLPEKVISISKL